MKLSANFPVKKQLVKSATYVKEYTISNHGTQRITWPRYVTCSGENKRTKFTLERRLMEGKVVEV
jgi:hypothetical protein